MKLFKKRKKVQGQKPVFPHSGYSKPDNRNLKFLHSGNCGDIIYALPALIAMDNGRNDSELYLKLDMPAYYYEGAVHPLGNVLLNRNVAEMIIPLLEKQPYIKKAGIQQAEPIDVDLNIFRHLNFSLAFGNIPHYYFLAFNVNYDLSKPWLVVEKRQEYQNYIVIARSERYRNPEIDYSFLKNYPNTLFIGVEQEYRDIKKYIPQIEWVPVKNFLEMAEIINSGKLFIGNQSFPFSIAEGLKVPRALEVCLFCPNVSPIGAEGRGFTYQDAFEETVNLLFNK